MKYIWQLMNKGRNDNMRLNTNEAYTGTNLFNHSLLKNKYSIKGKMFTDFNHFWLKLKTIENPVDLLSSMLSRLITSLSIVTQKTCQENFIFRIQAVSIIKVTKYSCVQAQRTPLHPDAASVRKNNFYRGDNRGLFSYLKHCSFSPQKIQ